MLTTALFSALLFATPAGSTSGNTQTVTLHGKTLLVTDLAGTVTIKGGDVDAIQVTATLGGADGSKISIVSKDGDAAELDAIFPVDQDNRFVYPGMGGHGSSSFDLKDFRKESDTLAAKYKGVKSVKIATGGRGLEAWCDLEVTVPRSMATHVMLGVGTLGAKDLAGAFRGSAESGKIEVERLADTDVETGSGSVIARSLDGKVSLATGSGDVTASSVKGDLSVATGSGDVEATDVAGESIDLGTGSGSVTISKASASKKLKIDTGSGSVDGDAIEAGAMKVETGSGDVTLTMSKLENGVHSVETGSGSVRIALPSSASVKVAASTGSGGIDFDVAGQHAKVRGDDASFTVGAGVASLSLDTGSGRVTVESAK
jgi:hypothetical protein